MTRASASSRAAPAQAAAPSLDWARPWWQALRPWGGPALAAWQAGAEVGQALNRVATAAPRFVPQSALPAGVAYEDFVHTQGAVPTRDNPHDFFNGLIWLACPRTKRRLNQLQAAEIARDGVRATRGPVRDAITLLDENGALLSAPEPLWQALAGRRWAELFGPMRPLWRQAHLWLLGHATLEKLLAPYPAITAHVLPAPPGLDSLAQADAWLAEWLSAERLAAKPFAPLPVLGVPGWWPPNEAPGFYQDVRVFRPLPVRIPGAGGTADT